MLDTPSAPPAPPALDLQRYRFRGLKDGRRAAEPPLGLPLEVLMVSDVEARLAAIWAYRDAYDEGYAAGRRMAMAQEAA